MVDRFSLEWRRQPDFNQKSVVSVTMNPPDASADKEELSAEMEEETLQSSEAAPDKAEETKHDKTEEPKPKPMSPTDKNKEDWISEARQTGIFHKNKYSKFLTKKWKNINNAEVKPLTTTLCNLML